MKHLVLLFSFLMLGIAAQAQPCTPDQNITQPGIYPDQLPDAKANTSYSEVIQFKFPKDTSFGANEVPIDSVRIDSVKGFPDGFSFQTNKPRPTYLGGENGCVVIMGTANSAQVGPYTITVYATGFARVSGFAFAAPFEQNVDFNVIEATGIFREKVQPVAFAVEQNYPNPFSAATTITFTLPQAQDVSFRMYDVLGKPLNNREINARKGENTITLERKNLPSGIYFYSIQYGSRVITRRMSIKN